MAWQVCKEGGVGKERLGERGFWGESRVLLRAGDSGRQEEPEMPLMPSEMLLLYLPPKDSDCLPKAPPKWEN